MECGACGEYMAVPWVDGQPRPELAERRRVYCDRPGWHVASREAQERRHYDRAMGHAWWPRGSGDGWEEVMARGSA